MVVYNQKRMIGNGRTDRCSYFLKTKNERAVLTVKLYQGEVKVDNHLLQVQDA